MFKEFLESIMAESSPQNHNNLIVTPSQLKKDVLLPVQHSISPAGRMPRLS